MINLRNTSPVQFRETKVLALCLVSSWNQHIQTSQRQQTFVQSSYWELQDCSMLAKACSFHALHRCPDPTFTFSCFNSLQTWISAADYCKASSSKRGPVNPWLDHTDNSRKAKWLFLDLWLLEVRISYLNIPASPWPAAVLVLPGSQSWLLPAEHSSRS